jgi:chorismate-pyruvate lyase
MKNVTSRLGELERRMETKQGTFGVEVIYENGLSSKEVKRFCGDAAGCGRMVIRVVYVDANGEPSRDVFDLKNDPCYTPPETE